MHAALKAAPGAHGHPTHNGPNRAGGLHCAEDQSVLAGASQHHGGKDGIGDAREQVAKEEDQLQPQQAGSGKDVAEAEGRLFEHIALSRFAFRGLLGLGYVHHQQCAEREEEGDHINRQNAGQADHRQQRPGQQRGNHARPGFHQRHQTVGAAQMLFGDHGADGGRVSRPLEGVANPVEHRRDVQVPELQLPKREQDKNTAGRNDGGQVADHHHQFAVIAVYHHAGEGRNEQKGRDEEDLHQAHGGSAFGLLVHPDAEREMRHAGSQHRDDLPQPDDDKGGHSNRF